MNNAVCCFANGSYLKGAGVALKTFRSHCNPDCDYFIFTDDPGVTPPYPWITVRLIDKTAWSGIETRKDIFNGVCSKFEACTLPYNRIVVLDSDIMAVGDVSPLLSNNYNDYSLIAIHDHASEHYYTGRLEELKLNPDRIINAGVLIFQKEALQIDWLTEFSRIPTEFSYDGGDQGYLNFYLQHINPGLSYLMEDVKFNYALDPYYPRCFSKKIVHFTGPRKPWLGEFKESGYRNIFHKIWKTKIDSSPTGSIFQ
jgi:lipopolysaccharide biosynthesis glycosyltransferase